MIRPPYRTDVHGWLDLVAEGALTADGFDDAIIGVSARAPAREPVVVYDAFKCVKILSERDGMDIEEAWEFFEFNVVGSWMGERTPIYVDLRPE